MYNYPCSDAFTYSPKIWGHDWGHLQNHEVDNAPKMKLTEKTCKNAKPKEKSYKLSDGLGLYLEVMPNGSKYWRMKYRHLGKEKRMAFGVYPEVSLKNSREKRDEARKLIAEHKDPAYVKKQKKNQALEEAGNTFEKIAREWHAHNLDGWKSVHAQTIMNRLEKDMFPAIGATPIKDITPKILLDVAKAIQERGANELAKRVIQMSKHIFQYAIITVFTVHIRSIKSKNSPVRPARRFAPSNTIQKH